MWDIIFISKCIQYNTYIISLYEYSSKYRVLYTSNKY